MSSKSTWTVSHEEEGRLDRFLVRKELGKSRSELQELIEAGNLTIDQKPVTKSSHHLKAGEIVSFTHSEQAEKLIPEAIPLSVLYEDEYILVVNKPVGMVVHPNSFEETGTLVQALLHHYPDLGQAIYDPESSVSVMRPGIVHRLDKDTSGVMVVAKTRKALLNLVEQFHERTTHKEYLALVHGKVTEDETVKNLLVRKPFKRNMMGVSREEGSGREAVTHFHPEASYSYHGEPASLLRCQIDTGRTHQIRVHAKYKGHPILGDETYANKPSQKLSERLGATRQLLHAATLECTHPETGKRISFEAPLAPDFETILTKLGPADSLTIERGT